MNTIGRIIYVDDTCMLTKVASVWVAFRNLIYGLLILPGGSMQLYGQSEPSTQKQEYVCLPCGSDCDHDVFYSLWDAPGVKEECCVPEHHSCPSMHNCGRSA